MVIRSFRAVGVEDIFNGADTTRARKACVNRQYRICFVWTDGGPAHVQIVDYHS